MFLFQLKLFLRSILKYRLYSFINLIGLAVGFCVFTLITLYVINEYSYDRFNKNYSNITRLEMGSWCVIPAGVTHLIHGQIPEIKSIARTMRAGSSLISYREDTLQKAKKDITLARGLFADSSFLDMFEFGMIHGDPHTALAEPMSLVITNTAAKRLFGKEDPLNKLVKIDNRYSAKITGVIDDSQNTHFVFDYLLSLTSLKTIRGSDDVLENLSTWNYLTYLLCHEDYRTDELREKIFNFLQSYEAYSIIGDDDTQDVIVLRPLNTIYFANNLRYEAGVKHGNKSLVDAFIIIALFILGIASINFINLSTARATTRAKEVGIKKVIGSTRNKLILQFISESVFLSLIAMLIAILLLNILIPEFNNIADTTFKFQTIISKNGIISLLVIALLIGIISGFYPAFYLSKYNPLNVLKGHSGRGKQGRLFRKALIIIQFIIAAILISGTFIVSKQVRMIKNRDMGFEETNVVNIVLEGNLRSSSEDFRQRLLSSPHIEAVSFSHGIPGHTRNTNTFVWKDEPVEMRVSSADPQFFKLYDIKLISGRFFDENLETDKMNTVIINEAAAKKIGWDDAVGKIVNTDRNQDSYFLASTFRVIGVIKDYHIESLHVPVVPMAIGWDERVHWQGSIKILGKNTEQALDVIEQEWIRINPDFPFTYSFLEDRFDQMYRAEDQLLQIAIYFSFLAIIIACLGLFGLSAFMTSMRNKEIGIRKVLGSTIMAIIRKFLKEYSILVVISNIIAIPLCWLVMDQWLTDYPFRIAIPYWIFLASFLITIVVAILTVSFHSYRAANKNPVSTLRYE